MPDADLDDGLSDHLVPADVGQAIPVVARGGLVKHQRHQLGLRKVATAWAGARAQGLRIDGRHSPQPLSSAKLCVCAAERVQNVLI